MSVSDMNNSDYQPGGAPMTGRRFLMIIVAFFGVIIAVNMTMLYLAVTNFSGLVVQNSYHAGRSFESDRARTGAAVISSWAVAARLEETSVSLGVADAEGAPVTGATLYGRIGRPSHNRADARVDFVEAAPGVYVATRPEGDGAWTLTLAHKDADGVHLRSFELYRAPSSR